MKKLIFLIVLLMAAPCWSATYDIGPGETYETFAAFHAAITPSPGDIVDGGGNTFIERVEPNGSGNSTAKVTYRNAVIDGNDTLERGISASSIDYIIFDDIEIKDVTDIGIYSNTADSNATHPRHVEIINCKISGVSAGTHGGIFGYGADVKIDNCEISKTCVEGIWWNGERLTVTDCNITESSYTAAGNGDCLQLSSDCSDYYVARNILDHSNNTDKQAFIVGGGSGGIFEYNKCTHLAGNESKCVHIGGTEGTIRYNEVIGGTYAIWIDAIGSKINTNLVHGEIEKRGIHTGVNATIVNNTVDANGTEGVYISNTPVGTVYNNIITGGWDYGFVDWGSNSIEDYNCSYGNTDNFAGQATGAHSIELDPLFTDQANDIFTLKPGSPCINAGVNLGNDYDDALNPDSTWPDGVLTIDQDIYKGWEIGAYVWPYGGGYKIW